MFLSAGSRARPNKLQLYAPRGTQMLFLSTAAPLFWTRVTTNDDVLLRIVGSAALGTGGSNGFAATFNTQTVTGNHTITEAELAAHSHGGVTGTANRYDLNSGTTAGAAGPFGVPTQDNHSHTIASDGSNSAHSHTITTSIKYVDSLVARKS
jgi:hypothetical protein